MFNFFKKNSKDKRVAIYTAIFGDKDYLLEPECQPDNCDFFCFTDSDNLSSPVWQIKKCEPTSEDPVRSAKTYKILPHKFFPEYEYSVWVDGNILVKGDVNKIIKRYLKVSNLAVYDHMQLPGEKRDCIYEEAKALLDMANKGKYKDDPDLIKKQMAYYKGKGYPEHYGLSCGGVIVRNHNEEGVKKVMEDWWEEIKKFSRRDQLSFNYVAWENNFSFIFIKGNLRNNKYFKHLSHKRRESFRT